MPSLPIVSSYVAPYFASNSSSGFLNREPFGYSLAIVTTHVFFTVCAPIKQAMSSGSLFMSAMNFSIFIFLVVFLFLCIVELLFSYDSKKNFTQTKV